MTRGLRMAFDTIYEYIDKGNYTDKGKDILAKKLFEIEQNMI